MRERKRYNCVGESVKEREERVCVLQETGTREGGRKREIISIVLILHCYHFYCHSCSS